MKEILERFIHEPMNETTMNKIHKEFSQETGVPQEFIRTKIRPGKSITLEYFSDEFERSRITFDHTGINVKVIWPEEE